MDAADTLSSHEPAKAVDGDPSTAWRCDGDGAGQRLVLELGAPVPVSAVTLVPGFAKTDPADCTDRYAQSRRIAVLRVIVDGGGVAEQPLDTAPTARDPQLITLLGTPTRTVIIEVQASEPGSGMGNDGAVDKIAISEVVVLGGAG